VYRHERTFVSSLPGFPDHSEASETSILSDTYFLLEESFASQTVEYAPYPSLCTTVYCPFFEGITEMNRMEAAWAIVVQALDVWILLVSDAHRGE
jgi:hypothetical protein